MVKHGFIREITDGTDTIKVMATGETLYIYEGFTGRELFDDILNFMNGMGEESLQNVIALANTKDTENIDPKKMAKLIKGAGNLSLGGKFMREFLIALVATATPEKLSAREIARTIPPHFFTDPDIITEVTEFLMLFIKPKKDLPNFNPRGSV